MPMRRLALGLAGLFVDETAALAHDLRPAHRTIIR